MLYMDPVQAVTIQCGPQITFMAHFFLIGDRRRGSLTLCHQAQRILCVLPKKTACNFSIVRESLMYYIRTPSPVQMYLNALIYHLCKIISLTELIYYVFMILHVGVKVMKIRYLSGITYNIFPFRLQYSGYSTGC